MNLFYHPKVVSDDISRLGKEAASKIKKSIEHRLLLDLLNFTVPLRKGLNPYRKLRVGDYRIILRLEAHAIKIIVIGHKKDVYARANKKTYVEF